jgi:BsuBI/PstI restriction endonuclease domain
MGLPRTGCCAVCALESVDSRNDDVITDSCSLFLIDVVGGVRSHPLMTAERCAKIARILKAVRCSNAPVFISAFPGFEEYIPLADRIAWGTHVWLANRPDHLIHYNNDRFLLAQL